MKKFLATIFALLLALFAFCGCGTGNTGGNGGGNDGDNTGTGDDGSGANQPAQVTVDYSTYGSFWLKNHNYKTMPVTAYNSCPSKSTIVNIPYGYDYLGKEQTFRDYYEAGINTMMGLYEGGQPNAIEQALMWCDNYGIAYLLPCSGGSSLTESGVKATYSRYTDYNAFAGVMQFDEPGYTHFSGMNTSREALSAALPAAKNDYLWHANLYPKGANKYQYWNRVNSADKLTTPLPEGGKYTWEEYVADYMKVYKPQVLSYDHYPLSKNGGVDDTYWYQLSVIRKAAMEANIPFWVYIATCDMTWQRVPSQSDLLWNVNSALSYGAKGIEYFCGVLPIEELNWNGCMFDQNGNKTDVYDYVKVVNTQVKAVDEVLMCSKSKGVMQVGTLPTSNGLEESDVLTSYGKLTSASGAHSLIGCFDYDGKDAYYITNNSLDEEETLTLTFSGANGGYYVKSAEKKTFSAGSIELTFAAGEGILVVLE